MVFNDSVKIPQMKKLNIPKLMSVALSLQPVGKIVVSDNNLTYLDIDDEYIHRLFPLLQNKEIKKPDDFGDRSAGAHITVIYPEENKIINNEDLNQEHNFIFKDVVAAEIGLKTYYILLVESRSLLQLRTKYNLPDLLQFKGYSIGFHITMGMKLSRSYT